MAALVFFFFRIFPLFSAGHLGSNTFWLWMVTLTRPPLWPTLHTWMIVTWQPGMIGAAGDSCKHRSPCVTFHLTATSPPLSPAAVSWGAMQGDRCLQLSTRRSAAPIIPPKTAVSSSSSTLMFSGPLSSSSAPPPHPLQPASWSPFLPAAVGMCQDGEQKKGLVNM